MPTQTPPAGVPYAPPAQIEVRPPTFLLADAAEAPKLLVIVLDTETGALHAERWQRGGYDERARNQLPAYYPGRDLWFVGDSDGRAGSEWWNRAPRRIAWQPFQPRSYYATNEADFLAVLDLMARWARELVDALEPLPDGGYDWTLRATAAYERIKYLAEYGTRGLLGDKTDPADPWHGDGTAPLPDRHHYGAVHFDEIVAADPSWADPRWATMTDAQLDHVAEGIYCPFGAGDNAKRIGETAEKHLKATLVFGKKFRDDWDLAEQNRSTPLHPVGVRAGLRRWRAARTAESTGMPAVDATAHLAGKLPYKLVATTGDTELAELARLLTVEAAHADKVALVGVVDYLARARGDMRRQVRAELAAVVAERRGVADHLAQLTARRASLLAAVAAFHEEPEWPDDDAVEPNYAELGRLGGMSRQAALEQLRPLFAGDDAEAAAEQAAILRAEILRWFRDNADEFDHKYGGVWASSVVAGVKGRPGVNVTPKLVDAALAALVDAGELTAGKDSAAGRLKLAAGR